LYVDDSRWLADNESDGLAFLHAYQLHFPSKADPPGPYLGMKVEHDRIAGKLSLSMEKFIDASLENFGMSDCKPASTPAAPGTKLERQPEGTTDVDAQAFPYHELLGDLLWISRTCFPEITYAVNQCSPHLKNYNTHHITAAKHVLRYLKGVKSQCLTMHRQDSLILGAYSDSDFANEPQTNASPMRSLSGMAIYFAGVGVIAWASKLQDTISHSTGEAEYRACGLTGRHVEYFRYMLEFLGLSQETPTIIYEDNAACIEMVKTVLCSSRTRHIHRDHHYIRELVLQSKTVVVKYCPTNEMVADIFTKALSRHQFCYLRDILLGHSPIRCRKLGEFWL
jgi:hypothetical protein